MNTSLLVLACLGASAASAVSPDQFLALVRKEAEPKWLSYGEATKEYAISCRSEFRNFLPNGDLAPNHPGNKIIDDTLIIMNDYGLFQKMTSMIQPNKKGDIFSVDCFNKKYSFELRGMSADKLTLKQISNPISRTDEVAQSVRATATAQLAGWLVYDKPLHELWADTTCTLEPVRQTVGGNYSVPFRLRRDGVELRLEVELNPVRGWRIESEKAVCPGFYERTKDMIYEDAGFPVPIPNRSVLKVTYVKTGQRLDVVTTFTRFESNPRRAETDFTLSAFGFPEPVGVTWEKPTPRYVWFLLAAGGFAVLMIASRYLARRRLTPIPV